MNYRFCLSFLIYALHLSYFLSKKVNLYDDVINVHEFQDQNDFQKHIQSDDDLNPMLVVFYSPWCPHCQHFVEPFSQFADHNQNRDIMFGAVNCERLNDICRSNKYVKGYPTLIAFNLPSTAPDYRRQSSKDGLAVSTAINDLQLFVNANVPLRATKSIPTVYKKVDNKVNQEEGVAEWVRIRAQGAARRAGPDDRLADALTSLDYLLSHELLDNYNEVTHTSVLTLLEVLCSVLPANYVSA